MVAERNNKGIQMPVELKTQRDGRIRDTWYGRYEVNGRKHYLNLDVKVAGHPPPSLSLRDEGDAAFERSRATALAKLESIVEEVRSQQSSERLVGKLYEIKTGERIKSVKLTELPTEWAKIARKRTPDERYANQCQSRLTQFGVDVPPLQFRPFVGDVAGDHPGHAAPFPIKRGGMSHSPRAALSHRSGPDWRR
jgi:hypothetical protein